MERKVAVSYPPGLTVLEEMTSREWTRHDLADRLGWELQRLHELLTGATRVDDLMADDLGRVFGVEAVFFSNLQTLYDQWLVQG